MILDLGLREYQRIVAPVLSLKLEIAGPELITQPDVYCDTKHVTKAGAKPIYGIHNDCDTTTCHKSNNDSTIKRVT